MEEPVGPDLSPELISCSCVEALLSGGLLVWLLSECEVVIRLRELDLQI